MSEYYYIVPWYNSEEWHTVYRYIFSDTNKQDALCLLQAWKARCPDLPSGIEATLCLLEVNIQDEQWNIDIANDQILRLAYSSALMRFVNHMLDNEIAKGTSLYIAAKKVGIPDWIVDLRHETAHSSNLPSLALLRQACQIGLQWLQNNYWEKHRIYIKDYTSGQKEVFSSDENIAALIHFCSCLSICSHSKIKKLADITDPSMQEAIVNDARELFGDRIDLSNLKTVSISSLINMLNNNAKKLLQSCDTVSDVNKALLGEESLLLSLDLLEYLSKNDFENKQKLSRSYVMCFEVLLTFLHANDLISDLVLALVNMTQTDDCLNKRKLAALWISEILAALKKSKQFVERANQMHMERGVSNKKKDLKSLYHHWFPNEKLDCLILDFQKPVPTKLTDIKMIQPIISSYNAYLTYFVRDLVNLVDPHLPNQVCEKICKLARLISSPEKFPVQLTLDKIYTVDDLKSEDSPLDKTKDDSEKESIEDVTQSSMQQQLSSGIWKLATERNWGTCPIGKVPWQQQTADIAMEQDST